VSGTDRFDVVGNQTLQERDPVIALDGDDASFG
jgi:hypothetical protein